MSEHTPDSNAEYLKHHPNAETDPDRANTAAYARKKIEDLIEIAQDSEAHEMESLLSKKLDEHENTAVAEYDLAGNAEKEIMDRLSDAVVAITTGEVKEALIYSNRYRLQYMKDLEYDDSDKVASILKDKILDIMKARVIISFNASWTNKGEGLPASELMNSLFSGKIDQEDAINSIYDTFDPNIILGISQAIDRITGKPEPSHYNVYVYHKDMLPVEGLREIAKYIRQDIHS